MASYLESYGAIEERKARNRTLVKRSIVIIVCAVILGLLLYGVFKNYRQEQVAKTFLTHLRNHEYQQAYRMWGCTEQTPCRDYAFSKFMEDWGPSSGYADAANAKISVSQSCGNGVFLRIVFPNAEPAAIIVEKGSGIISFAPPGWTECPGRHWHFWDFFKSLFRR